MPTFTIDENTPIPDEFKPTADVGRTAIFPRVDGTITQSAG